MNTKILVITLLMLISAVHAFDDKLSIRNEVHQMQQHFEEEKNSDRVPNKVDDSEDMESVHSFENDAVELDMDSKKHN